MQPPHIVACISTLGCKLSSLCVPVFAVISAACFGLYYSTSSSESSAHFYCQSGSGCALRMCTQALGTGVTGLQLLHVAFGTFLSSCSSFGCVRLLDAFLISTVCPLPLPFSAHHVQGILCAFSAQQFGCNTLVSAHHSSSVLNVAGSVLRRVADGSQPRVAACIMHAWQAEV